MPLFRPQVHERRYFPPAGPAAPAIAIATTLLSTGLSIASQVQQANAQSGMASYQAQVARNQQTMAEWNAQRALQQGGADEQRQRTRTAELMGAQRAALAGQGGDINSGSAIDLLGDTARAGELDARTIRSNAGLRAYDARVEGYRAGANAGSYEMRGANAMAGLPFGIGSSLLGLRRERAGTPPHAPSPSPPPPAGRRSGRRCASSGL